MDRLVVVELVMVATEVVTTDLDRDAPGRGAQLPTVIDLGPPDAWLSCTVCEIT